MVNEKRGHAFTLIELLVVISIIALLLAILMPALSKVKKQAQQVFCMTRQKDLGMAFSLYTTDNRGKLPASRFRDGKGMYGRWMVKVAPYYEPVRLAIKENIKETGGMAVAGLLYGFDVFRCPTQDKVFNDDGLSDSMGTYGYNVFFSDLDNTELVNDKVDESKRGPFNCRRLDSIRTPGELPLLCCLNADTTTPKGAQSPPKQVLTGANATSQWLAGMIMFTPDSLKRGFGPHPSAIKYGYPIPKLGVAAVDWYGPAPNHNGKCNFVFADFHVEGRNICKIDDWPWYGKDDGKYFHPRRNTK